MDPAAPTLGPHRRGRRLRSACHDQEHLGSGTEQHVSSSGEGIAAPLVRGVLAAAVSLGTALALVVVPALAAQVAGTQSSATVLDAVIIGLNLLVLGHGGGVVLSTGIIDGAVTLTPFGLLGVLMLIAAVGMRRVGRVLDLVRDDGVLRPRAIRDAGGALGAYAVTYALGVGVLAAVGRSADSSPVVTSAVVSGALVAVVGGLAGTLWSLRRPPTDSVPGVRVLGLLPRPFDAVARSAAISVIGLLGTGMLATVVMLLLAIPAQSALYDELAPGIVGGLVLTLIQLALLPLLAVWTLVVLLGGTVGVGTSTELSLAGAETGVLPALPMLAALPAPGDFPAWTYALLALPLMALVVGAVRLAPDLEDLSLRDRLTGWIAFPVAVAVAVLLIAGLSTGGIGDGRLVHLGPQMSTLAGPLLAMVALSTALVAGVLATPLIPWVQKLVAQLRERVEGAEQAEGTEASGRADSHTDDQPEGPAPAAHQEPADEKADEPDGAGEPGVDGDEDAWTLEGDADEVSTGDEADEDSAEVSRPADR